MRNACYLLALSASSSAGLTLSPTNSFGAFDGCGVSLCWWANVMGGQPSITSLMDLAFNFSRTPVPVTVNNTPLLLPSLGFNIARYNAGATSSSPSGGRTISRSPNMPAWKGIGLPWSNEAVTSPELWDWGADASQIAVLRMAAARGARKLELFSNSPPWWQLANSNPSGASDGAQDNLLPAQQRNFAVYLASVAAQARDAWGVNFSTIEAFNEPASTWWRSTGTQEGCHFSVAAQEGVLALLAQEVASRGLALGLAASDDNAVDEALATWKSFAPATRDAVAQVNVHGYEEGGDRAGLYAAVQASHKALRDSEYGDGDGSGLTLASSFCADWAALHPNGWTYWQLLDEAQGWGALRFSAASRTLLAVETKHFVLAQFSRHLRPGMTALGTAGSSTPAAAAWSPATGVLAVVLLNVNASPVEVLVDMTAFASAPDSASTQQWRTDVASATPNPSAAYSLSQGQGVQGKKLRVTVPGRTVLSLEVEGVAQ